MCTDPFILTSTYSELFRMAQTAQSAAKFCFSNFSSNQRCGLLFQVTAQVALFIVSWICLVASSLAFEGWVRYFGMCLDTTYNQFLLEFFLVRMTVCSAPRFLTPTTTISGFSLGYINLEQSNILVK